MFNIAVVRLKDIIKYLFALIIIMSIIYSINRYFSNKDKFHFENINLLKSAENIIKEYNVYPINNMMSVISMTNNETIENSNNLADTKRNNYNHNVFNGMYTSMLGVELPIINEDLNNIQISTDEGKKEQESNEKEENNKNEIESAKENETKKKGLASGNVNTEVVTQNPIAEKYTDENNNVKIKNETDFELTKDILNTDSLEINTSNIIIFHTHTCESYTSSEEYLYNPTGNFRTTDLNYSVVRVGNELTSYLSEDGFNVIHDKTFHDYPAYSGSYNRSYSTVSKLLENNPADIIIDLHRDAIGNYSSYAPTVKIGDDYCAQIMFVMGTNGGGLSHPNWQSNLKFAVKVQEYANKKYPGLFKPIILRNSRYNQNLGKAACIIEVGSTGNTLEQCLNSMKYFSDIMNEVLK